MSWDVSLMQDGKPVYVQPHTEGGTYKVGGNDRAELNITYNYAPFYYNHLDEKEGLRWLHGKTGAETKSALRSAIHELGVGQDRDYWKATPGNAGAALAIFNAMGVKAPHRCLEG